MHKTIVCFNLLTGSPRSAGIPNSGRIQKKNTNFIFKVFPLKIGTWNVRTLMDSVGSDRPQCRTALVVRKLRRYVIHIATVSEKVALDTLSSGVNAKVKRGGKHELAFPVKYNLLVCSQNCRKATMSA